LFIGFFGINQVGIFTYKSSLGNDEKIQDIFINNEFPLKKSSFKKGNKEKYLKSGLKKDKASKIYNELKNLIDNEKLYTNPELSLIDIATILKVHPNNLSQVINTFEEKNFYDYINNKRVDHFIELVKNTENKKFTLLSIAFDSGFNSKSSFNKHFKKATNKTPTEYIKSI
jgi:AraC-like DNA-binding protein